MDHTPHIRPGVLLTLRLAKRLSVAEFADAAGVSESAVYRLEQGLRTKPRMATVRRLADALDVDVEALLVEGVAS